MVDAATIWGFIIFGTILLLYYIGDYYGGLFWGLPRINVFSHSAIRIKRKRNVDQNIYVLLYIHEHIGNTACPGTV